MHISLRTLHLESTLTLSTLSGLRIACALLGSHCHARYTEELITLATGHCTGTANTTLTQWKRRGNCSY